jgi:hypothetical protein
MVTWKDETMELVNKGDQVIDKSESYRGGRRCFNCGNRGNDIDLVYYRSRRGRLRRHFLCADCRKIYASDIEKC